MSSLSPADRTKLARVLCRQHECIYGCRLYQRGWVACYDARANYPRCVPVPRGLDLRMLAPSAKWVIKQYGEVGFFVTDLVFDPPTLGGLSLTLH